MSCFIIELDEIRQFTLHTSYIFTGFHKHLQPFQIFSCLLELWLSYCLVRFYVVSLTPVRVFDVSVFWWQRYVALCLIVSDVRHFVNTSIIHCFQFINTTTGNRKQEWIETIYHSVWNLFLHSGNTQLAFHTKRDPRRNNAAVIQTISESGKLCRPN